MPKQSATVKDRDGRLDESLRKKCEIRFWQDLLKLIKPHAHAFNQSKPMIKAEKDVSKIADLTGKKRAGTSYYRVISLCNKSILIKNGTKEMQVSSRNKLLSKENYLIRELGQRRASAEQKMAPIGQ